MCFKFSIKMLSGNSYKISKTLNLSESVTLQKKKMIECLLEREGSFLLSIIYP